MAIPFLKTESEENATQAIAFIAITILTIGLMVMNVSGAIAGSRGTSHLELTIRVALAVILAGAELLAAVALVRVMLAPNRLRKVIGGILFLGLAWACIQNGKRAVHLIFPEFAESADLLEAKAGIAGEEAALIASARQSAIDATPQELARVRQDIASLKAEQQLMSSQSPEKIKEAQALLIAQGKYFGRVDGIRADLTEAAMRARGEEISRELTTLGLREEALAAGAVTAAAGVAAATENPLVLQADLQDRARRARQAALWLEVMLWVFEGARSLGLWVYVTTITARNRTGTIDNGTSDDVPAGHVRVVLPQDEWDIRETLWQQYQDQQRRKSENRRRQNEDRAPAGSQLKLDAKGWKREIKQRIQAAYDSGLSPEDIASEVGLTWPEYENIVNRMFNRKAAAKYLGRPEEDSPDPRAAVKPEQPPAEPGTEPGPQSSEEWPVAPYEPPANDDPDNPGKEQAA